MAILEPFNPAFRGSGTPGAPGVGSTRRGLQLVEQGENVLATQERAQERGIAAQPGLIEQDQLALESSRLSALGDRKKAELTSLVSFSARVPTLKDEQILPSLTERKVELQRAGLPTDKTDDAIQLAQAGSFNEIRETAEQLVGLGRQMGVGLSSDEKFSPTTTTLPDGTTIQTTSRGRKVVTDAAGQLLKGSEAIEAIKAGEQFKTEEQIKRAGGKRTATLESELELKPKVEATTDAAKAAIKESTETFKRLEPLQQGLGNIDDAIRLIDEGAQTGVIASRLPSIRKASIELDTLQKKLGLDVIASTTFGALSEGEREFALSTALPKTLKGPDLKKWLEKKKQTQEKLIGQLQEASVFLGTPGNTIADFIELKKVETLDHEEAKTANADELAEGTIIRNPSTGQRLRLINGEWAPVEGGAE